MKSAIQVIQSFLFTFLIGGCSLPRFQSTAALCPAGETLQIGIDQQLFSLDQSSDQQTSDIQKLESFLRKVTSCPIQIEPIVSPQLGRKSIESGRYDFAFLAPTLSVLALGKDSGYVLLRSLGQDVLVRSAILVPENSRVNGYSGLNNLGHPDHAPATRTRLGAIDPHLLPSGALLMHSRLNSLDYTGLLKDLDENSFQLPAFLRYGAGTKPELASYNHFIRIVETVDQWDRKNQPISQQKIGR